MTGDRAAYCMQCGAIAQSTRFCLACGSPLGQSPPTPYGVPGSSTPTHSPDPPAGLQPLQTAQRAYGLVAQFAGPAGMASVLPWQTIAPGETPDLRAMFSRLAAPGARALAQRSLKKPGLALAATTVLDLFVAGLSGGGGALLGALPRVLAGSAAAALSLVTGTKGGTLRTITGIVSVVTALVQVISLALTLVSGVSSGAPLLSTLSMVVAIASALTMAVKTAVTALRRPS